MAVPPIGTDLPDRVPGLHRSQIRQDKRVINKAIYLALGVTLDGHKELLGLWLSENERAKF